MHSIPGTELVQGTYFPVLEVGLRLSRGESHAHPGVVDSGADMTSVPAEFLEGTSVDYTTLPVVGQGSGAGGTFPFRLCQREIWWEKWKVCDQFIVLNPGQMGDLPTVLLGRADFFTRFDVRFEWSRKPIPYFHIRHLK